jgi:phosphoesterase RecJ-like protein
MNEAAIPLINIDRRRHNAGYGTINIVDEQASSISELVHKVLHAIDHRLIDTEIATALLTGMIIATNSFRAHNVRPETLALASQLIETGAQREKIIHHLYRSRSLSTLRLWGVALTRLKKTLPDW